jgi:hypothetical protein
MWGSLTNLIDVRRRTAVLLNRTSAGQTMTWDRQPVREALVELHVLDDGTAGTGTVTVTGTSAGVAQTETLTFTGPGFHRTTRAWTALAGITTSGLADEAAIPSLEAKAVGPSGTALEGLYTLKTGWPASINPGGGQGGGMRAGSWPNDPRTGRGAEADASAIIAWDETWAPRRGDLVTDDTGSRWEVIGLPRLSGTTLARLWNVRLKAHESE